MFSRRSSMLVLILALFLPVSISAQPALTDLEKRIFGETLNNSKVMQNLEYLSYMIGPRLTGSENMDRANEWTAMKFREYGLENVRQETWNFGYPWYRGEERARIVEPVDMQLIVAQMGFTPGTDGPKRAAVTVVKVDSVVELELYRGKLKGKIVLLGAPSNLPPISPFVQQYLADSMTVEEIQRAGRYDTTVVPLYRRSRSLRTKVNDMIRAEGALAVIRDSGKEYALLNMTGGGGQTQTEKKPIPSPTAFMIHEHYAMLYRLLQEGKNVVVEMHLGGRFGQKPVDQLNTVAEIPGTEKFQEVVIAGGHLDSWDLGQGTTDNGTGTMAMLEAARILKNVGAKPKRTIRFIMFTGEEQDLLGSKAYVEAHASELERISGVFIMDEGTGKIRGIGLQGREEVKPVITEVMAPLSEYGVNHITMISKRGTDHLSFHERGVPGFAFILDPLDYNRKTHHTQADTFDHASEEDLQQAAAVIAITVLRVANLPDMLPRKSETSKVGTAD